MAFNSISRRGRRLKSKVEVNKDSPDMTDWSYNDYMCFQLSEYLEDLKKLKRSVSELSKSLIVNLPVTKRVRGKSSQRYKRSSSQCSRPITKIHNKEVIKPKAACKIRKQINITEKKSEASMPLNTSAIRKYNRPISYSGKAAESSNKTKANTLKANSRLAQNYKRISFVSKRSPYELSAKEVVKNNRRFVPVSYTHLTLPTNREV
eukprot:TRINITY_DN16277_c0_g1_i3.p1 TRINITY_DN16277_c0_g1~~TRINITY_DN16277_c0_g1_i3.p1  ORF type:complete len:206 (-),score=26.59 TRINITY_DN16277_c0_g1_i3:41-658(-)